MTREDYVLAVMSVAEGGSLSPVRVQKLFFLLDDKIPGKVGGPYFEFAPYDYGPFDANVYHVLESLKSKDLADIKKPEFSTPSLYRLTVQGQKIGEEKFKSIPDDAQEYIVRLMEWIREKSFRQIVSSMYKYYPDMRTKSGAGK